MSITVIDRDAVIPAQAGIQRIDDISLDSRLRGNDVSMTVWGGEGAMQRRSVSRSRKRL